MLGRLRTENITKTLAPLLLIVGLCFSLITIYSTPAFAQQPPVAPSPGDMGQTGGVNEEEEVTCAIEKLGWVLCPVIEQAGDIGDKAFQLLANNFLETEPELVAATTGGRTSGTYVAWELARNIANVMFIIAFLIIIYSQVTGAGLNNYGIKKLLPRLIIAAIAVNTSYYICQAMVDLTNILGYSIKEFLVQTATIASDKSAMPVAAANGSISQTGQDGVLKTIALGVLGVSSVVMLILPMLGVSIAAIFIACLAIIVILMMRKAFIVLLVVLAPIAFVLYLLPNTERYFKKWASMFWQLLLVFPVVALLFGGGQLASAIVLTAGSQTKSSTTAPRDSNSVYRDESGKCIQLPSSTGGPGVRGEVKVASCGAGSTPFMLGLTAALIAVAPLFAVWSVLKGALSAAGAIGGKVGGTISSIGDRAGNRARKAEDALKKSGLDYAKYGVVTSAAKNRFRGGRKAYDMAQNMRRRKENRQVSLDALRAEADSNSDLSLNSAMKQQAASAGKIAMAQKAAELRSRPEGEAQVMESLSGQELSPEMEAALSNQQSSALSEAVKNLEATIDPSDIRELAQLMNTAFARGDQVLARAVQNAMLKSSAGQSTLQDIQSNHAGDTTGVMDSLRQNALNNHPGLDDKWSAYADWAQQKHGGGDLNSYVDPNDKLGNVADIKLAKFASQGEHSKAQLAGLVSQSLIDQLNHPSNANLRAQFKGESQRILESRGVRFN